MDTMDTQPTMDAHAGPQGAQRLKEALKGTNEVDLTVTGRKTGRKITNPVWFVQEGEELYLMPVRGSDSDWFKNVQRRPTIGLAAMGAECTAQCTPITDAAMVQDVARKFRAKYGANQVQSYYTKLDAAVEVPLA